MAGEPIADAYVRLRPDMTKFRSETLSGGRETFKQLAKIAAGAFAIRKGFEFGKDIIEHAGQIQKQIEAIKSDFGDASDAVLAFNEKGAAALGISAHLADTTATRFGILFKNLGVGQEEAAKMTVGFIKLAGSISAIRGIDPAIALQNLPLAAAGNLRSLKQLGIATDQTQLKIAAFKLGLTSSIKQGLTPATRAQAIYAIATQNLDKYQQQVKEHSGDLINVQHRLAAEWDNAKDKLGAGLLPAAAHIATILSNVLPRAVSIATGAFKDLAFVIGSLKGYIAPAFDPIIAKIKVVREAFAQKGGAAGIDALKQAFISLTPVAKVATVAVLGLGAALAFTVLTASPFIAITAAIVAVGVAAAEAYKRSEFFRSKIDELKAFISGQGVPAIAALNRALGPVFAQAAKTGAAALTLLKTALAGVQVFWRHFGDTIIKVTKTAFAAVGGEIKGALRYIQGILEFYEGLFTLNWKKAWGGLKDVVGGALDAVTSGVKAWGKVIIQIFDGVWEEVRTSALEATKFVLNIIGKIPTHIRVPAPTFRHPLRTTSIGFDNPAIAAAKAIEKTLAGDRAKKSAQAIADAFATNTAAALDAKNRDITQAYDAPVKAAVAKVAKDTKPVAVAAGNTVGTDFGKGLDTGISDSSLNTIKNIKERLAQAIKDTAQQVKDSVISAQQNLAGLGTTLADQLGQIIDNGPLGKTLKRLEDQLAGKTARAQSKDLRKAILDAERDLQKARASIAPSGLSKQQRADDFLFLQPKKDALAKAKAAFVEFNQQAVVGGLQAKQAADKTAIKKRIDDLINSFNKGALGVGPGAMAKFSTRLSNILEGQATPFKIAGKTLGTAFIDSFIAQVGGTLQQAAIIQKGRKKGSGIPQFLGAGITPSLENPGKVLSDQLVVQRQIRDELKYANKAAKTAADKRNAAQAKRDAKAAAKAAKQHATDVATQAAIDSVNVGTTS